jgi:hypothetical protein
MKAPTPALPQEPQPKKTPTEFKKKKTLLLPNKQALMLTLNRICYPNHSIREENQFICLRKNPS